MDKIAIVNSKIEFFFFSLKMLGKYFLFIFARKKILLEIFFFRFLDVTFVNGKFFS